MVLPILSENDNKVLIEIDDVIKVTKNKVDKLG